MYPFCYLNGEIIPVKEAKIELSDLGLLRGYGVFDFFRTYNNKPFLLDDHLDRFTQSAKEMQIEIPVTVDEIKAIIDELISKNEINEAGFRIVLTVGSPDDGFSVSTPNFFILVEQLHKYPDHVFVEGVKLATHEHLRHLSHIKTTNYIIPILMQKYADEQNAFDILYTFEGNILETTRSNFFVFYGKTLVTPKENILIGRTRNFILKMAAEHFEIEERPISTKEINSVDEAFISGSTRRVTPVVAIDDATIKDGKVGTNTRFLQELFEKHVNEF